MMIFFDRVSKPRRLATFSKLHRLAPAQKLQTMTMTMTKPPNMAGTPGRRRRRRPQTRTCNVALISISAMGAAGTAEVLAYTPSPPLVVPRRQIRRNAASCSIRRTRPSSSSSSSGRGPLRSSAASLSGLSPISSSATSPAADATVSPKAISATSTTSTTNNSQSRAALWHKSDVGW